MPSGNDWVTDWPKAEVFSMRIGEVCSTIPLRGGWEPNDRIAFAMASFRLAQEHHSSIHLLASRNKYASANALGRPLLEAALRTIWIAEDATEQQIVDFGKGRGKLPLLAELDDCFTKRGQPPLNGRVARALHSFTHGGLGALGAQFLEGTKLEQSNAAMITMAGLFLGTAGCAAAKLLDRQDLLQQIADVVPDID